VLLVVNVEQFKFRAVVILESADITLSEANLEAFKEWMMLESERWIESLQALDNLAGMEWSSDRAFKV